MVICHSDVTFTRGCQLQSIVWWLCHDIPILADVHPPFIGVLLPIIRNSAIYIHIYIFIILLRRFIGPILDRLRINHILEGHMCDFIILIPSYSWLYICLRMYCRIGTASPFIANMWLEFLPPFGYVTAPIIPHDWYLIANWVYLIMYPLVI